VGAEEPGREQSYLSSVVHRFAHHRAALISLGVLVVVTLLCVFAPYVTPYRPGTPDLSAMMAPPSWQHIMGTNNLGVDLFAQTLYAGRISLEIGLMAALVGVVFGGIVGAMSGYYGGWIDTILMRIADVELSIPLIFIILLLALLVGATPGTIILIIGGTAWMVPARIVRSEVLSLRERDFTEAARAAGAHSRRIILREIMPNALAPLIVNATIQVGNAIIIESIMDFLGAGLNPPNVSWGWMLNQAQSYLEGAWWMSFFPGLMIWIVVLAVNLVGDGLRDALDPTAKSLMRRRSRREAETAEA
jgi:peptide/nickel transport system permease protein